MAHIMLRIHHTHLTPCSSQMQSLCLWCPFSCSYLDEEVKDHALQKAPQNLTTVGYLSLLPSHSPPPCHSFPTHFHVSSSFLDHDFLEKVGLIHLGISRALPRAKHNVGVLWLMDKWMAQYQGLEAWVEIPVTAFASWDKAQICQKKTWGKWLINSE